MIPWLFLAVCLVGAAFSASALIRARRLWYFTFPYFMGGWLTSELALHHIAWQAVATVVFVALGALSAWPGQLALAITLVSWGALLYAHRRAGHALPALRDALTDHDWEPPASVPLARIANPFRMRSEKVEILRDIAYGESLEGDKGRRNLLDVIRPADPGERRPALLQVHGGAWVIGDKEQQGQPLMRHLAERGWVCFAINYRLGPRATWPAQIVDVKRAIAWIREHAAEHGADPDFLCITGGSAGGHLSSLAALTPDDPAFQPGFEQADTRLAACVPFYGVYDFLDRLGIRGRASMQPFLQRFVFKCSPDEQRELWENASPVARVHESAPPFFVVHGTHDSLAWVEEARAFVQTLRDKSRSPVVYAEIPGAQHAFEIFHSVRSAYVIDAVTAFLERVHAAHREGKPLAEL